MVNCGWADNVIHHPPRLPPLPAYGLFSMFKCQPPPQRTLFLPEQERYAVWLNSVAVCAKRLKRDFDRGAPKVPHTVFRESCSQFSYASLSVNSMSTINRVSFFLSGANRSVNCFYVHEIQGGCRSSVHGF